MVWRRVGRSVRESGGLAHPVEHFRADGGGVPGAQGTGEPMIKNGRYQNTRDHGYGDFQDSCRVNHSRSLSFLSAIDVTFRVEPNRGGQRPIPDLA